MLPQKSGNEELANARLSEVERFHEPTPEQAFLTPILKLAQDTLAPLKHDSR